jgi:hypothetical protein
MSDQDDLTIDFTGQEAYGTGFEPVPRNWYKVVVTDWEASEVKKPDGKFPQGTPGTRWELTIDGGDYDNRRVWINHWHHPKSLPFLKGFLQATGKFSDDELSGQVDLNEARERAVNSTMMARVIRREADGGYDASNEVKAVKPVGSDVSSGPSNPNLP